MGKVVSSIGSALGLGGGGSARPQLDRTAFDISKQAKEYEQQLKEQQKFTTEQQKQLSEQLAQQAKGEGPLAGAAMRAAASRNLAQTLAAAQAAPSASPLAARQIMQLRGQQGRELAQAGLQERLQSQQALAQQLAGAAETARLGATSGFQIATAPSEAMREYEQMRFAQDVARRQAVEQQQQALLGMGLGAAGAALSGGLTGGLTGALGSVGKSLIPTKAYGGMIAGNVDKANDSIENDTELNLLSPGEMVVPATVVAEGPKAVHKFAKKLIELEKQNPSPVNGYAALLALRNQSKGKKNG